MFIESISLVYEYCKGSWKGQHNVDRARLAISEPAAVCAF